MDESSMEMPLLDHIAELRKLIIVSLIALIAASVISFILYEHIVGYLFTPLLVLEDQSEADVLFINSIFEGFITKLKISLLSGLGISFPVHVLNLVIFIFPGLTKRERRIVTVTLIASAVFIVLSFMYGYYSVVPISIQFLTSGRFIPARTGMLLSFSGNIFYILQFLLVALVVFQVPLLLEILMIMNVVSRRKLWKAGRYVVIVIFVLAAIVTPPDFVTQVSVALPLTVLYFLSILIAKIFKFGGE